MIGSPGNEGPIGTMPKSTEKENRESVTNNFRLGTTTASEWNIYIVPEPSREGDVPSAPKLCNVAAEVRDIEVSHQLDTEEFR